MTAGVAALGAEGVFAAIRQISEFADFTKENDPHGEHDFGSVLVGDQRVFWKIDYYDTSLTGLSPDPADEELTRRVLTVMLSSEY